MGGRCVLLHIAVSTGSLTFTIAIRFSVKSFVTHRKLYKQASPSVPVFIQFCCTSSINPNPKSFSKLSPAPSPNSDPYPQPGVGAMGEPVLAPFLSHLVNHCKCPSTHEHGTYSQSAYISEPV
jgi:hypothetical protein